MSSIKDLKGNLGKPLQQRCKIKLEIKRLVIFSKVLETFSNFQSLVFIKRVMPSMKNFNGNLGKPMQWKCKISHDSLNI